VVKLRIAHAARDDLRQIRIYSKSAFGAAAALDYLNGIRALFALIRDRPLAGGLEEDLGEGIRSFGYRSHRIYYRVYADEITVVRILHHARDILQALGRDT